MTSVSSSSQHFRNVSSTLNLLGKECRVDVITSSQTFFKSVQIFIVYGHFQNFHRKLFYAHYRILSTHSQNAFSSFHFTLCTLFYLSFWFMSYMAATATFQLTFPEACWNNIIVRPRGSEAVCRERSFSCHNAIHQLNLIACMFCVKRNVPDAGCCPGGTGCGAKKEVWKRT